MMIKIEIKIEKAHCGEEAPTMCANQNERCNYNTERRSAQVSPVFMSILDGFFKEVAKDERADCDSERA